ENSFGTVALIAFVALLTQTVHSTLLLLPLVWLPLLLLTSGLGYLLSGLTVFLRDIPQALAILLNLWFYATPILYPADLIPQPFQTLVFWLNPLAAIAALHRDIVLIGDITHWSVWLVATAVSSGIFFMGYWCYQKLRPAFADVL
ncbi:MAG: ABC transporter permease, partial [Cyanobacteria bacterium J06635_15]